MIQTFLFTDIEASTRLWEEHPAEMPGALALHDSILHDAVASETGKVLKTTGDGMVAIFGSAGDAVVVCLRIQAEMAAQNWSVPDPIKVRMGVHSGDAEERDGDFFGPTLNRASRIMSAAHGGQVLLSHSAAEEVGDRATLRV